MLRKLGRIVIRLSPCIGKKLKPFSEFQSQKVKIRGRSYLNLLYSIKTMAMALCCAILLVTTTIAATHPPLPGPGKNELLPGLTSSQTYDAWMTNLLAWRRDTRIKLNLNTTGISAIVRDFPVISKWATETIVQPQVHIYDRYLWNETLGTFTVDVYLDDLRQRYGGIDSVLLWAGYPNLGIDERNQLDLLRLADIDIVAQQLRERGVHVLIGYNPWDSATRREPYDDAVALAKNLPLLNVEGFNGDTMAQIPREFWNATLEEHAKDPSVPPLVFEPEGGGYGLEFGVQGLGSFDYDIAGWGYMQAETLYPSGLHVYDMVPGVDRAKWLTTDGMRLTHVCDRWQKSRSDAILLAFFNGIGYESWENVWGIWNGMTKRDGELLRRMATLLRWTSTNNLTRGYQEDGWRPHTKDVTRVSSRVHASRFVGRGGSVLYTMVNLDDKKACNVHVSPPLITKGWDAYDLYNGVQLERSKGSVLVCVEGRGVSAVLFLAEVGGGVRVTTLSDLDKLLTTMASMTHSPLSTFDPTWHVLPQQMVGASTSTTDPVATTHAKQILIPRCTNFSYQAAGVEIEGDCDAENDPHNVCCTGTCNIFLTPADNITGHQNCQCAFPSSVPGVNGGRGVDVQFPWEGRTMGSFNGPRRNHNQLLDLGPFLMDK